MNSSASTNPKHLAQATDERIDRLEEQIAEVLKVLSRLTTSSVQASPAEGTDSAPLPEEVAAFVTRRSMLKRAALATLGAATVLEAMPAAKAANGGNVILGQTSSASASTTISTTIGNGLVGVTTSTATTASGLYGSSTAGTGVVGVSTTGSGVYGMTASSGNPGVMGAATGNNAAGVYGTGNYAGVYGASGSPTDPTPGTGVGVLGLGNGYGAFLSGSLAPLYLEQNPHGITNPNDDTNDHVAGELYVDFNSGLWYCVTGGTPGVWNRLATAAPAQSANAGNFALLSAPTRFIDTRTSAESPSSTGTAPPAPNNVVTTYKFSGTGALVPYTPMGTTAPVIPFGATSLVGRVTVQTGLNGHTATTGQLKVSNVNPPGFGSGLISWGSTAATQILPFVLGLDNSSGTTGQMYFVNTSTNNVIDLIVDVTGFYY